MRWGAAALLLAGCASSAPYIARPEPCVCPPSNCDERTIAAKGAPPTYHVVGFTREVVEEELARAGFDKEIANASIGVCARVVKTTKAAIEQTEPLILPKLHVANAEMKGEGELAERKRRAFALYDEALEDLITKAAPEVAAAIGKDIKTTVFGTESFFRARTLAQKRDHEQLTSKYTEHFTRIAGEQVDPVAAALARTCVEERLDDYKWRWVTIVRGK